MTWIRLPWFSTSEATLVLDMCSWRLSEAIVGSSWVARIAESSANVPNVVPLDVGKVINKNMENLQYCTALFLDVSQTFGKVWHPGLLIKIKRLLPLQYLNLLKSYLSEGQFETKFSRETSSRFHIHSEVHQVSILGPLLCPVYIWLTNIQGN
jgi:hypothetical protein